MDTCDSLEKLARLKRINDQNEQNLRKLGIDMSTLPNNITTIIKEFVETQQMTGLHELDLNNLELWHLHQKEEMIDLEQGVLKPLQRKVKKANEEVYMVNKKINSLEKAIADFKKDSISDGEYEDRVREIGSVIEQAEKAITETPLPSVQLDCDQLINSVNAVNAERKLKSKKIVKKH
ncbi:uncharacterized protein LOC119080933 [Bradysia coprophila]|uniref:uncharacterized protein LOC119080933 n=1 Tax=Bradysia coprophila TaxID=38358 RepID=UPI00187DD02E|nr:uncharacterized protein LOC119080933 [Bradysia coprophila]